MRRSLSTVAVLGLALWAGVAPSPLEPVALAQSAATPFPASGLVRFLPAGEVIGDGSPVTLHVLALDAAGQPMTGFKPRITATEGNAQNFIEIGGGLYKVTFVPPITDSRKIVSLKLRGKNAAKQDVEVDTDVTVSPRLPASIGVGANPAQITLGQDAEATVTFTVQGAMTAGDLLVAASSGEILNLTDMGSGRFTARYVAPKVNYPHLGIVTVADKRDPTHTFGQVAIPLLGKTDYPVKAPPAASVILRIGTREFGPVTAAADGKAVVPVVVSPGITSATLVSVVGGQTTEEVIDLRVPETKRIAMIPGETGLPGDAALKIPVRAVLRSPDGGTDGTSKVVFTATAGTFSAARHEGNGIWVAEYTPAPGQPSATLTVAVEGSAVQTDSRDIDLVPVRPASVALTPEPTRLGAAADGFKLFAKITAPDGRGLADRELLLTAAGAKPRSATQDLRNGDYRADFLTSGTGPVELIASVRIAATGNPLRRVLVFPARESLPNDSKSTMLVTVVTVDEFGYPVPDVQIALTAQGDGTLPAAVTTDANGLAQVYYTAGRSADLVGIVATTGNRVGSAAILQVPAGVAAIDLPLSGSDTRIAVSNAWAGILTPLRLEREGATTTVVQPPAAVAGGTVSALKLEADPAGAAPGAVVPVKIHATDADGRGVAGQQFELLTSVGKFGPVTDAGAGDYTTSLSLPMDASGEAKVSIATADGHVSSFLKIPIGAAAASAWGATLGPAPTVAPAPVTPAPVTPAPVTPAPIAPAPAPVDSTTVKKPAPPANDVPWLRIRASYVASSYRYQQQPVATTDNPLLPDTFSVGGQSGGPNATPMGFELAGRGFSKSIKYLGFDAGLRMAYYSITTPAFGDQAAPDWLVDGKLEAIGRYPFEAGGSTFHVGARLGFRYSDFIYFQGCLENNCTVKYQTLPLPGLAGGVEVGAEVSDLFLVAGLEEGVYFATPYLTSVDVEAGYHFSDAVFADVGFEAVTRRISIIGASSHTKFGELSDGHMIVKVGAGYAF